MEPDQGSLQLLEQDERWPVRVLGAALLEQLYSSFFRVQDDHRRAEEFSEH